MPPRHAPIDRLCGLAALACLLAATAPARAGLVVEVQSVTAAAGSSGNLFDVTLMNAGTSDVTIAGFSFELTSSPDITFTDVTTATTTIYIFDGHSLFGPNIMTSAGSGDVSASDNYDTADMGTILAAGPTLGLGHVSFDVAPSASGVYDVSIQPCPATSFSDPTGATISDVSFVNGTITIQPVPEPSSLVSMALGTLGIVILARRKVNNL